MTKHTKVYLNLFDRPVGSETQIKKEHNFVYQMLFVLLCLSGISFQTWAQNSVQRPTKMEFDARVIQGQRAEGAVYLFQRASRPLPSLLKYKRDYLSAIVTPVFSQESELGQKLKRHTQKEHLQIGTQSTQISTANQSPNSSDQASKEKNLKKKVKPSQRLKKRSKWRKEQPKTRK